MNKEINPGRFEYLDAARGLAALSVAFAHSLVSYNQFSSDEFIWMVTGRMPVLFFFLLSGFVLGGSLQRDRPFGLKAYGAFLIRRFFRLYPMLFVMLLGVIALRSVFVVSPFTHPDAGYVELLGRIHSVGGWKDYWTEFTLQTVRLNAVAWTLQVEFVCSLLLPILHLLSQRRPNWIPFIFIALVVMARAMDRLSLSTDLSLKLLVFFYLGYLVSRIPDLASILRQIRPLGNVVAPLLVVFVLVLRHDPADLVSGIVLTAFFILVTARSFPLVNWVLALPLSRVLGRCSYSFYLLHMPIMLAVRSELEHFPAFFRMPGLIQVAVLFGVSALIALPLALASERFVERPGNRVGHWISQVLHQRQSSQMAPSSMTEVG